MLWNHVPVSVVSPRGVKMDVVIVECSDWDFNFNHYAFSTEDVAKECINKELIEYDGVYGDIYGKTLDEVIKNGYISLKTRKVIEKVI